MADVFLVAGLGGGRGCWLVCFASSDAWDGGFFAEFGGAKTNRHLFRAGASRPTACGHESSSGRPQRAIIGKSIGYFGATAPPKSARNPPHARAAHSEQERVRDSSCRARGARTVVGQDSTPWKIPPTRDKYFSTLWNIFAKVVPLCGKIAKSFSIVWNVLACFFP